MNEENNTIIVIKALLKQGKSYTEVAKGLNLTVKKVKELVK